MNEYLEKLRSISFGMPSVREQPKVTTFDSRDTENESAKITEHWNGRQDVEVCPPPIRLEVAADAD